jgi:hypothetical protein
MCKKHDNFLELKKTLGEFLEKIEYFVEYYFLERNSPQNKNAAEASYLKKISVNMQSHGENCGVTFYFVFADSHLVHKNVLLSIDSVEV